MTPFSNEHFAAYCKSMVGQPYWYGTCGYNCTENLMERKAEQYPSHYGSSRIARYKQDIKNKKVCCDCIGGSKAYAWTNGGVGLVEAIGTGKSISSKYGSNKCPDKSANGMFEYAKSLGRNWGSIGTIPEVVGLAVHCSGHVGYYIGNGKVVEWRGFQYGCVITELKKRTWTHWYELPFIDYSAVSVSGSTTASILGTRLLKRGHTGADVKELQELLNEFGFDAGKVDGDFGYNTEAAVKRMQTAANIEVDGKYGNKSHAALMDMVADNEPNANPSTEKIGKKLIVTGNRVNVRSGAGTQYKILTVVKKNTELEYTAQASNGWYSVMINGETGWISNKYTKPVDN